MQTPTAPTASLSDLIRRAVPYAALITSMITFCFGASFAKQLFPLVGAEATTACRVGFAALILCAVVRPWRYKMSRADLLATMRYGAALGGMNLCFYMSLRTIPLGLAISIEFLGPLSISLFHSRRPMHFAMVGLAVAGLSMLLPIRPQDHALDPIGVLFGLGAAVGWAAYIVFGQRTSHMPGGPAVALGMVTAALVVVPIGLMRATGPLLTPAVISMGVITAILSSAIPYSLEMVALKAIPARTLGVMFSLEPAIGALVGAVLMAELLTPLQGLAVAMVVGASVGMILTTKTPTDPNEAAVPPL
jgi:inner membrane transporter RhtA